MNLLAQTTAPAKSEAPPLVDFFFKSPLPLLVILMVAMLWFSSRTKKKEQQSRDNMLSNMKKGDRIQTIGGILGTVVEARESEIVVKVDETTNTKLRFTRSAIARVVEEEKQEAR